VRADQDGVDMKPPLSPAHQAVADELHEEARSWGWRAQLIADRIAELEKLELASERALKRYTDDRNIADAVQDLRQRLANAELCLFREEYDHATSLCERVERDLIALRQTGRELEAVL
jgi:hypothetical protein